MLTIVKILDTIQQLVLRRKLKSTNPNFDTYKTLNGYSEEVKFNSIGKEKEFYKTSVIANRRHFIANVRLKKVVLKKTPTVIELCLVN